MGARPATSGRSDRGFLAIVLLLGLLAAVALAPYAGHLVNHYPDERHYSDGGMVMLETGDYLTPRTAEGQVRGKKPPGTYWVSAAGMAVFGKTVFGSRAGWLVLAATAIVLTFVLGRAVGAGAETSALGAALLSGDLVFLRASVNAIPDLPLLVGVLVAAIGFAGLILRDEARPRDGWLAYGGTGLAILAKGLLPLVLLAWTVVFLLASPRRRARLSRLWRPGPMLVGLGLPAAWFAWQALSAGGAAGEFLQDQITQKATLRLDVLAESALLSVGGLVVPLALVLGALAAVAIRTRTRPDVSELGDAAAWFAGWIGLVVFVFLFTAYPSYRYILPAMPFACLLVAAALTALPRQAAAGTLRVVFRLTLVLVSLLVLAILVAAGSLLPAWQVAGLVAAALAGTVLVWRATRGSLLGMSASMAAIPYGAALILFPVAAALALPDVGAPIARRLDEIGARDETTLFVGADMAASKIRLHAGRSRVVHVVSSAPREETVLWFDVVVTEDPAVARRLESLGFVSSTVRGGWRDFRGSDLTDALAAWDLAGGRARHAETAYVLVRPRG